MATLRLETPELREITRLIGRILSLAAAGSFALTNAPAIAAGRAAPQPHAAAETYTCEGLSGSSVRSIAGDSRNNGQVSFSLSVNRATGQAVIFRVSGSTVIRAGRYTLAAGPDGAMAVSWDFTDDSNVSQPVAMTISRKGDFAGSWSGTNAAALAQKNSVELMKKVLGPFGDLIPDVSLVDPVIRGSFSGICWQ